MRLPGILCSLVLLYGCSNTNNKPLSIVFSADSTKIVFDHIDQAGLLELQHKEASDSVFNGLISVLSMPSEQDVTPEELPVAGKVMVTDSNLVFIPLQPFVKGRDYLVITYLNIRFGDAKQVMKGKLNYRIQPLQKVLSR